MKATFFRRCATTLAATAFFLSLFADRRSSPDGDGAPAAAPVLRWIGPVPEGDKPVSFGIPFAPGEFQARDRLIFSDGAGRTLPADSWPLAYWPDGSVKWGGFATVVPGGTERVTFAKAGRKERPATPACSVQVSEEADRLVVSTGALTAYIPRQGLCLLDSLCLPGACVAGPSMLVCTAQDVPYAEGTERMAFRHYRGRMERAEVERAGQVRALVRLEGHYTDGEGGRQWLPFVVRLYFYAGSSEVRLVHSFVYDGDINADFIRSLGVRFAVPLREQPYNRHVAFATADGGVWSESVQPLSGRRVLTQGKDTSWERRQVAGERIPEPETFDEKNRHLLDNWAVWGDFRLSQPNDEGYAIRKRTREGHPWIGTYTGRRALGYVFAGDVSGGLGVALKDFWQAYPAALQVDSAATGTAYVTAWLWSPEGGAMDLRHYDNRAHDLIASYEDVQPGMSTPYGIARTHTLTLLPEAAYPGKAGIAERARRLADDAPLLCTPDYLHAKRAFGTWSLPDSSNAQRARVEHQLTAYLDYYLQAVEQHKWYGFWNYGDFMHAYDAARHEWKYDVGGFAWDNTELASNMWLWYSFLRTGRPDVWRAAEAMTRHTSEVDVYHLGPFDGLGSRHNVSHWGCGAKEARISQAAWNRFYHYLTTDERCGDLMRHVKDAEQKLYTLDPMRLALPRDKYPCTAPARLRIGPDWLAYAGNWMTEWERTRNTAYRDKIVQGMRSIARLPQGFFTGPGVLGFDPATGVVSYEGDTTLQSTSHLMTIMGGFEVMNEMMDMIHEPEWERAWLEHARDYQQKALTLNRNRFRVSRLKAYAAYKLNDRALALDAWKDMWTLDDKMQHYPFKVGRVVPPHVPAARDECPTVTTNDAALWSLEAIYMQEVIPYPTDEP